MKTKTLKDTTSRDNFIYAAQISAVAYIIKVKYKHKRYRVRWRANHVNNYKIKIRIKFSGMQDSYVSSRVTLGSVPNMQGPAYTCVIHLHIQHTYISHTHTSFSLCKREEKLSKTRATHNNTEFLTSGKICLTIFTCHTPGNNTILYRLKVQLQVNSQLVQISCV